MSSSLIVEVCKVEEVFPHPNADRMEIILVKGWRTCIGKGQMKKGDLCVYIPPNAILPIALSDRWNVTNYLAEVRDGDGNIVGGRVKVARLRGEPSYGFAMAVEDPLWVVGFDVAEHYGITKWEPPQDCTDGDAETPHPAFHHYYNIENLFNFPDVIKEGEEVVFTEKIHGMNARVGLIRDTKDDGTPIWRFMAGSHDVRRKELQAQRKRGVEYGPDGMPVMEDVMKPIRNEKGKIIFQEDGVTPQEQLVTQEKEWFYEVTMRSRFFEILDTPGLRNLLVRLCNGQNNVIIFGEFYGTAQDMHTDSRTAKLLSVCSTLALMASTWMWTTKYCLHVLPGCKWSQSFTVGLIPRQRWMSTSVVPRLCVLLKKLVHLRAGRAL